MITPTQIVAAANQIGERGNVSVRYEYDRVKREFRFRFYRQRYYIGSTLDPKEVIPKMEKYAS